MQQRSSSVLHGLFIATVFVIGVALLAPSLPAYAQAAVTSPAAATWYVDAATGNDSSSCGAQASPCRSIQAAIDHAQADDTILVAGAPGGQVYTRSGSTSCDNSAGGPVVVCVSKRLTILGGYSPANWSTADPTTNLTIIDGQTAARGVNVKTSALQMEGFTIQNGLGNPANQDATLTFAGGMGANGVNSLTLRHMIFTNNKVQGANRTAAKGGYAVGGGLSLVNVASATLEDVEFTGNQALAGAGSTSGGYGEGGALFIHSSTVTGSDLVFSGNRSQGGNTGGSGNAEGRGDAFGAAATIMEGSSVSFNGVVAENNTSIGGNAGQDAGGAFGGAFKVEKSQFTLLDSTLRGNTAQSGGSANGGLGMGGAVEGLDSTITLNRVVMLANQAIGNGGSGGGNGGAIRIARSDNGGVSTNLTLINCIIAGNSATNGGAGGGGGIAGYNSTVTITYSTIADNTVDDVGYGSALLFQENSAAQGSPVMRATVSNSIISGNHGSGGTRTVLQVSGELRIASGVYSENTGSADGNILGLDTTIDGSPAFRAPGAPDYDYRIGKTSVAIDKGTAPIDVDYENQPRTDGKPDFGADEYFPPPMPPVVLDQAHAALTTITLAWHVDADVANQVARYRITHTYLSEGTAGTPITNEIDAGLNTSYELTDLKPYSLHTITIDALDGSDTVLATSGAKTLLTTDLYLYLPYGARPQ